MNPENRETGTKTWQRPEGSDMDTAEKSPGDLRKSCDLCCSRKRRCDGDGVNACSLCSSKGQKCTYSKKGRRGPKPKPKRSRDLGHLGSMIGISQDGDGMHLEEGGLPSDPNAPDWEVEDQHGSSQPPPHKVPRVTDIVRLSPPRATGTLGLTENEHLNAFFGGFGACTQIVQEDEIRGAMIHILTEGQFGMPDVEGKSFYFPAPCLSYPDMGARGNGDHSADDQHLTDLPMIRLAGGGLGIPVGNPLEGSGSAEELRQRAQRARLSAGVACLWAGIGVGAMLGGQTAEATLHYAENAREAIKGCYDVVSEEVLRAFLCLAHMHSFREDFPKFFRYTSMANNVAASLDRQGEEAASEASASRPGGSSGPQPKGCSEPAKFLLKCFEAMSDFLELEGEEVNSYIESGSVSGPLSSTSSAANVGEKPNANGETGADVAEMEEVNGVNGEGGGRWAAAGREEGVRARENGSGNPLNPGASNGGVPTNLAAADPRSPQAIEKEKNPVYANAVRVQKCISVLNDNPVAKHLGTFALSRRGHSSDRGGERGPQRWGRGTATHTEHQHQTLQQQQLSSSGGAMVASDGDRMSGVDSANSGGGEGGGGGGGGWGLGSSSSFKEESHLVNQVLFVGDTRILEVSMSVDCSCIGVMIKAVSGADWAEIAEDARVVANTADAILVPVLASSSISQSICAVKLLADSAFSHLCLGNADDALRAMRRFCAILKTYPGIMRFPPWRHCFHWMEGMLQSAGLRDEYNCLRDGLLKINMKSMQTLPEFGNAAHDMMCKCTHFRCQATHRALAEHAKRDPYGSFHVPAHCPQYGTAAKSASEGNSFIFRHVPEASQWLGTAAPSSGAGGTPTGNSGDCTRVGVGVAQGRLPTAIATSTNTALSPPSPLATLATAPPTRTVTAAPTPTPTVKPAVVAVKPRRGGAVTAKTAAEAASAAARRRPAARTVSISESEPGSMSPSSKPASQTLAVGSPPPASPSMRSPITTRARVARMSPGGRVFRQVSPGDGGGGETGRGTGRKGLSGRPQLGPREFTGGTGAQEEATTAAEGAAGAAGAAVASTTGAHNDISRSVSSGVHPEPVEANICSTKCGVADGQQRPSGPVSGSSFDVFAEIEPVDLHSGFERTPPISVGPPRAGSGPTVPGDASPTACSGKTGNRTTSSSSVFGGTSDGVSSATSTATSTATWPSVNNASSALLNPCAYNPSGPPVAVKAPVAAAHGTKSDSQHSANSTGTFRSSSSGGGGPSAPATSTSMATCPSVDDASPAPPNSGACDQSKLGTTFRNFSTPYGGAGGTVYDSPIVDSVGGRGDLVNSGVGVNDFNAPIGVKIAPRTLSTSTSTTSVGGGMNLPVHGGIGGAALVPGPISGLGVGSSPPGVTTSPGIGNVRANDFTVPGNGLTSAPRNGLATGAGNVNLRGPWLGTPRGRSFNLGPAPTSFRVGVVTDAPSNGVSIGGLRGGGVNGTGDTASEFYVFGKENQQLWDVLLDDSEIGVSDMDIEMNAEQQGQSELDGFTQALAGMLSEESKT